jgi:DNA-directed RNA polymerase specialized sigma24 family protein
MRHVLEEFLQTRGPSDRRFVRLSQQIRLPAAAIAARLGGSAGTVHQRHRRLRHELDAWLQGVWLAETKSPSLL